MFTKHDSKDKSSKWPGIIATGCLMLMINATNLPPAAKMGLCIILIFSYFYIQAYGFPVCGSKNQSNDFS